MPRRIGNTTVPRNHVARSLMLRRGGAHQRSRTSERQQNRARVRELTDDWREELEFEREVSIENEEDEI